MSTIFETSTNSYGLPDPLMLMELVQNWRPDVKNFRGSELMPRKDIYTTHLMWKEKPPIGGMTKASALDAAPRYVSHPGEIERIAPSAFWKEAKHYGESELLNTRAALNLYQRAGEDLIAEGLTHLQERLAVRMEWLIWQAIMGTIVVNEDSVKLNISFGIPAGNFIKATSAWTTPSTGSVLADMRRLRQLRIGKTNSPVQVWMNGNTAMLMEENSEIVGLVKNSTLLPMVARDQVFSFVSRQISDCVINEYNGTWLAEDGSTFSYFLPDNIVVAIYPPTNGQDLGKFISTPSLFNGTVATPAPGPFLRIKDRTREEFNPYYDMMMGLYGLPCLQFPKNVVIMDVSQST